MPVYQPGIPTGTVNLDVDYQNLQGNFEQANIVYGGDHYPFDNATPNQGFHNLVTTPPVVNNPPDGIPPSTSAGILKLYAYQQYSALGPLQWSRGPNNAIPTPITFLMGGPVSINASGGTSNIIDFAGFTRVMCFLSAFNDTNLTGKASTNTFISFSQGTFNVTSAGVAGTFSGVGTGTVLQLRNNTSSNLTNVYWTLQFIRIE